ncbi:hypothetical protein [Nocardia sp. NPDC057272]|uniref:hypothetical protein n=1 Tax=Nocardia sp. NPDC057272 TaxID=3346079 RepID=UPI00362951B6
MRIFSAPLLAIAIIAATYLIPATAPAYAQTTTDCSKREPAFPNQNSAEVMRNVPTRAGWTVPVRRGFYCVPDSAKGNIVAEARYGWGFGYDKVRHRHSISSLNAIHFVLTAERTFTNAAGDTNFRVWARERRCQGGKNCVTLREQEVLGSASKKSVDPYDPGRMPGGDPLGLLTVYCVYGDGTKLRCDDWVNNALKNGTNPR